MGGGGATPNPKKLMKELKKHYQRAFLALIKAYKRYYLGVWIIKLPFYKLTSNQHKITKWQAKRDERLEFLHNALKTFKFLRTFDEESKKWLNSPEFKAKYLDTKHPYPPLLNPDSVDYKCIPAELAWEINLPLPPNYDFIYFVVWGCASRSTLTYFSQEGLRLSPFCSDLPTIEQYKLTFDFLKNSTIKIKKILLIHSYTSNFIGEKYLYLVVKNVPVFIVVRDPISIVKTWANHTHPNPNKINKFNLTFDYHQVLDCIVYDSGKNPNMDNEGVYLASQSCSFAQKKYLPYFTKNPKIIIDASDLSVDNAYRTMQNLGKKLNFTLTLPKKDYVNKSNTSTFHNLFPFILICHSGDLTKMFKGGFEQRNMKSLEYKNSIKIIITDGIRGNAWRRNRDYTQLNGIESQQILFFISQKNAQKLYSDKSLFESIKEYLQGFIKALNKRIALESKNQLAEKDILEYFAKNKAQRQKYKTIFDENLSFYKELCPDIVESWKYYNEFEKMCAELDKSKERQNERI